MAVKTPKEVSDAIKKLDRSAQVLILTFIAKLKSFITDLEEEVHTLKKGDDPEDGHAHYHGHQKCESDHSHSQHGHTEPKSEPVDHDHSSCDHASHSHEHEQKHHDHKEEHNHGHNHEHKHDRKDDDMPEWKQKAMAAGASDPSMAPFGGSWNSESSTSAEDESKPTEAPFPDIYDENLADADDFDQAMEYKTQGTDFKSFGDFENAILQYTKAITTAKPTPLLYANRADCLLKTDPPRPNAAIRDCKMALEMNPDSAKALRISGKAKKNIGDYEGARKDLSASQSIDFDDAAAQDLIFVMEKVGEIEAGKTKLRLKEEVKLRKRAEEIKLAREEARKETAAAKLPRDGGAGFGGMPGMGGGMPEMGGMGGLMSTLMSDPELAAGMSNPKIMAAFSKVMSSPGGPAGILSNPAQLQEIMGDPEVGPFMQKIMAKLGGGAMGGMPDMSEMGEGSNDDIPDMDDIPNLD